VKEENKIEKGEEVEMDTYAHAFAVPSSQASDTYRFPYRCCA